MAAYARDILLVEDDAADALLIRDALAERGGARAVTRVEDGIAALEHLRAPGASRPDLILLDLNMPRMNGHELLGVLKADQALRTIPVVILTTSESPVDVHRAYTGHANAYVVKPMTLTAFTHAVRSIDEFFLDTAKTLGSGGFA